MILEPHVLLDFFARALRHKRPHVQWLQDFIVPRKVIRILEMNALSVIIALVEMQT